MKEIKTESKTVVIQGVGEFAKKDIIGCNEVFEYEDKGKKYWSFRVFMQGGFMFDVTREHKFAHMIKTEVQKIREQILCAIR